MTRHYIRVELIPDTCMIPCPLDFFNPAGTVKALGIPGDLVSLARRLSSK